jgi:uncharacterized protein YkwD
MPYPLRRIAFFTLLCTGLLLPAASIAKAPNARKHRPVAHIALGSPFKPRAHVTQQQCANTDETPTAANLDEIREAILCLHNQIRAEHGLPPLRDNARLRRAALGHSQDMVGRHFFDHTTPGGTTFVDRIMRARYANRHEGWSFGENLAWGTGSLSTPRGVLRAWMDSPGHRANILRRSYREVGVGVVVGIPAGDGQGGATYTADFGVVRR